MKKKRMTTRLIVVTGGPGAGKTAVLELARKAFSDRIAVLPEAATIIFGGGFWRKQTPSARKAAQRAIFHVQRELERLVVEENQVQYVLCDRGTLDGLAYWPGTAPQFFREMNTTMTKELKRYHCVIHLRTPAAESGYNHANPLRIETPEEAAVIDDKILRCWKKHARHYVVSGSLDFLEKADKALDLIRAELDGAIE